jgi:hypothetical protein
VGLLFNCNPSKLEAHLNNIKKFRPYFKYNTGHLHYNINWLMLFREIFAVHSENHTKPINELCGQKEELAKLLLNEEGHTNYHCASEAVTHG